MSGQGQNEGNAKESEGDLKLRGVKGLNASGGSREPNLETAGLDGHCEPVSSCEVVTSYRDDGAKVSKVRHPPRMLRQPGQIKAALESGAIDLDEFLEVVRGGLHATKFIAAGAGETVEFPDWPARLKFLEFITVTVEGMPIKRQEIISKKLTTAEDMQAQAAKSPALRRQLRGMLDRIESEQGKAAKSAKATG